MKIKVKKEEFLKSLNIVNIALSKGNNIYEILECIYIDATKDKIYLISQDGKEITIKTEAEGEIIEKGSATIKGSLLIDFIKYMPELSFIDIEVNKDKECVITCGESIRKNFQAKDETTYPNVISVSKENKIVLNEMKLKKILDKTTFSYDKTSESGNIVLKGIYFNVNNENFTAKSMDAYIISIINEKINNNDKKYETIVPGSALEELNRLIKGEVNRDVKVYFNEKNISFEFNKTIFTSIIIPSKYIDIDRIFNIEYSTKVVINKDTFNESLVRSIPFISNSDNKPVILDIKDDSLVISLSTLSGDSYEKIDIKKTGKDLTIGFNANNLIKILRPIEDENINLYFSGPKNPIVIKDKQETYTYLLIPVKM